MIELVLLRSEARVASCQNDIPTIHYCPKKPEILQFYHFEIELARL